ncbi:MAG: GAF domain-containing protein [Candidatus Rokubacteria bacterium]|nr:GAF domain-containing protein [Candidatus Rokubacteria bacterium]
MKTSAVAPGLITALAGGQSLEEGLARSLELLLRLTGARAAGLVLFPRRGAAVSVLTGVRGAPALERWLRDLLALPRRPQKSPPTVPPRWKGPGRPVLLRVPLHSGPRLLGRLVLLGRSGRRGLTRDTLPAPFHREFGIVVEHAWQRHQQALRLSVMNELTALMGSTLSLEELFEAFASAVTRLIALDSLAVTLIDRERKEFRVIDVTARSAPLPVTDTRMPLAGTLVEWVTEHGVPRRADDLRHSSVPSKTREVLLRRGYRSALVAPLFSGDLVIGTVNLCHREPCAFDDGDVEILQQVARPLAAVIEHRRLMTETRQRAEELGALSRTSQLMTSRLELPAVLETISRSVTELTGGTGCGIGLLDPDKTRVSHVAAHGFRTPEWRSLSLAVGEGIIGRVAATGVPIRTDDVRADPRSAQRDVDEREGLRSMLVVPLRVGQDLIGVISAFSTEPSAFSVHHQAVLEAFADQAGIAIQNARLFEDRDRWARQMQALDEAGRAVNRSLDLSETIRVILVQARDVLGAASCGLMALDPEKGELSSVGSLDLAQEVLGGIRLRVGEGITGMAVLLRRPVQSTDLYNDPRVLFPQLPRESGFRSMLAVPLLVGDGAIGAITVFRKDIHHFSEDEEDLLSAFADRAAMALEHARLFSSVRTYSEQLEVMVGDRTRALDEQKRFVEVVLETLPLGLYVLDRELSVVTANQAGGRVLPCPSGRGGSFLSLVPEDKRPALGEFLGAVFDAREMGQVEEEITLDAQVKIFRFTAAPLESAGERVTHAVLLIEDITLQKRLARQMLLTERLTTAGRLAAGVAHELNNPLATIAGCAESLRERAGDPALSGLPAFQDFPSYLKLIEEEAYRCKEITGSLLQFVREPGSRRAPIDLNGLVEKALELLRHQARFAGAECLSELDRTLPPVLVNEGQIRQVFLALAANALEAMEGKGCLRVRSLKLPDGDVVVEVDDQGPGIPDDVLPRIFDPFFTTKPPGQGTGLGLAIAQGIVADHGGLIEVETRVGRGTTFRVTLPGSQRGARR